MTHDVLQFCAFGFHLFANGARHDLNIEQVERTCEFTLNALSLMLRSRGRCVLCKSRMLQISLLHQQVLDRQPDGLTNHRMCNNNVRKGTREKLLATQKEQTKAQRST